RSWHGGLQMRRVVVGVAVVGAACTFPNSTPPAPPATLPPPAPSAYSLSYYPMAYYGEAPRLAPAAAVRDGPATTVPPAPTNRTTTSPAAPPTPPPQAGYAQIEASAPSTLTPEDLGRPCDAHFTPLRGSAAAPLFAKRAAGQAAG